MAFVFCIIKFNNVCHVVQCVAVDAVVETDLVSALKVSVFPVMIYTKAGKILFRDKGNINSCHCLCCACVSAVSLLGYAFLLSILSS